MESGQVESAAVAAVIKLHSTSKRLSCTVCRTAIRKGTQYLESLDGPVHVDCGTRDSGIVKACPTCHMVGPCDCRDEALR